MDFYVQLWEDNIEKDEIGEIKHHPLNSRYFAEYGKDTVSYGHLTFGGHNLDKSSKLDDVTVFYLEFQGESKENENREAWADPLRAEVLHRLTNNNRCWYLSMIDRWFKDKTEIGDVLTKIVGMKLNQVEVKSEKPYGYTYGFKPRVFFEIPNNILSEVVKYFWSEATPGYPIEGYNMETGQIEVLSHWDASVRDDKLFRNVIDQTFVNFYTFPAEHRFFVFVTNKLNYSELANLIGLEELQKRAKEMGTEKN